MLSCSGEARHLGVFGGMVLRIVRGIGGMQGGDLEA